MFSIKLKTKAGNDVKKKQTFTVFYKINFERGNLAQYTYRILSGSEIYDSGKILTLKNADSIRSVEEATLKIILNMVHIIKGIVKDKNITPDLVMFISDDLNLKRKKRGIGSKSISNRSWMFLKDAFYNESFSREKSIDIEDVIGEEVWHKVKYQDRWSEQVCNSFKIKKEELDLLRGYVEENPNTRFMAIDPNRNVEKYAKSIQICNMLKVRIENFNKHSEEFNELYG